MPDPALDWSFDEDGGGPVALARLRIRGRELPGRACAGQQDVQVGVQCRGGGVVEVVDLVPADAVEAVFDVALQVLPDADGGLDYRGPSVHGRRGQRFVYLSWGSVPAGGQFAMFRRAKLNLAGLPAPVEQALAAGGAVEVGLALTDARGGPVCASVPADRLSWSVRPPD